MPAQAPQPSREKLSKVPSWIMLGAVLGGVGFYGAQGFIEEQRGKKQGPKTPPAASAPARPATDAAAPAAEKHDAQLSLFAIDAVFRAYGAGAIWEYDLTEIVLWNPETGGYDVAVEVLRNGDTYHYRLLDRLSRPVLTEGIDPNAPIRLTEPASYLERRKQQRLDAWRSRPLVPPAAVNN